MKISNLSVRIEPWDHPGAITQEMSVVVTADGTTYSWVAVCPEDDFVSRFDYMIEAARREILKAVKAKESQAPQTDESAKP